jgi:CelD/BcsL family acetyltransferase involved in cellulose biosynthesis
MMDIVHITTDEDFTRLDREWDSLLRQSPVDDVFLTWEWLHTWWKHYGSLYRLCLLAAYEEDRLVGIAPLMMEVRNVLGYKIRVLRNIGMPAPDVAGIIAPVGREDVIKRFARWLVDNRDLWDVLMIREIPPAGMDYDVWNAHFPRGKFTIDRDTTCHFFIPMDGNWNNYYTGLSNNLQKRIKKKIRLLNQGMGYRYDHKRGQVADPRDIEIVFRINRNARYAYLYRSPTEQEFHQDLAEIMADRGWLDMYFLYAGGIPVAFYYGFWYNHAFEFWRSGFDSAYSQFSVGTVLLFLLIQDGFEHGMEYLDFLQGDEEYKLDWQVRTRLFSNLQVVRNAPMPLLVYIHFSRFKRTVRDYLRRYEILHPVLKWIGQLVNLLQDRRISATGPDKHNNPQSQSKEKARVKTR